MKKQEAKKMKKTIKGMLNNIVGEDTAEKIFEANFPKPITGYKPGEILTLAQLRALPENTIIFIHYIDEDGELREKGFQKLSKQDSETEWSAGAFPFPIKDLKEEQLLSDCDNCGWTFTIREALPDKKNEWVKSQKKIEEIQECISELQEDPDNKQLQKKLNKLLKLK